MRERCQWLDVSHVTSTVIKLGVVISLSLFNWVLVFCILSGMVEMVSGDHRNEDVDGPSSF